MRRGKRRRRAAVENKNIFGFSRERGRRKYFAKIRRHQWHRQKGCCSPLQVRVIIIRLLGMTVIFVYACARQVVICMTCMCVFVCVYETHVTHVLSALFTSGGHSFLCAFFSVFPKKGGPLWRRPFGWGGGISPLLSLAGNAG